MIHEWETHLNTWKGCFQNDPDRYANLTVREVLHYWQLRKSLPLLQRAAVRNLVLPPAAACVERTFSKLTRMDSTSRQSMRVKTLRNLLILNANQWLIKSALTEVANSSTVPVINTYGQTTYFHQLLEQSKAIVMMAPMTVMKRTLVTDGNHVL